MEKTNFCCGAVRQGNFCSERGETLKTDKKLTLDYLMHIKSLFHSPESLRKINSIIEWVERAEIKSLDEVG